MTDFLSPNPSSTIELPLERSYSDVDLMAIKRIKMASDLFSFAFQVKYFQQKTKTPMLTERELYLATMGIIESACAKW